MKKLLLISFLASFIVKADDVDTYCLVYFKNKPENTKIFQGKITQVYEQESKPMYLVRGSLREDYSRKPLAAAKVSQTACTDSLATAEEYLAAKKAVKAQIKADSIAEPMAESSVSKSDTVSPNKSDETKTSNFDPYAKENQSSGLIQDFKNLSQKKGE